MSGWAMAAMARLLGCQAQKVKTMLAEALIGSSVHGVPKAEGCQCHRLETHAMAPTAVTAQMQTPGESFVATPRRCPKMNIPE